MKITASLHLQTDKVLLRPMQQNDFDAFFQLTQDEDMWKYFTLNLANENDLKQWMQTSLTERNENKSFLFTIIEKQGGAVAGSMRYLNIFYHDLRLEIGGSWLGKNFRGTDINLNAKYCLLRFAFEQLNFERVEFKTDVLNERAKKGLRKIGGKEEGIFRSHMTMWNNRRRNSIYYSIIKPEWQHLKETVFKEIKDYEFH